MIIPVGHDDSGTRRRPWVAIAIIVICLGAWLATWHSLSQMDRLPPEHYREEARLFWEANPYLEIDRELASYMLEHDDPEALSGEEPFTEESWELWLLNKRLRSNAAAREAGEAPTAGTEATSQQDELDRLVAFGFYLEANEIPPEGERPSQRYGLIPAELTWHGLVTHVFMHASWAHILGNLFLFFLAAPALEDRWGRPLFALFYLAVGVFAGGFHAVLSLDSSIPLVGASGAIAGVLGAFLVLFWKSKIKFAYYLFPPLFGTFRVPAWIVLPLWFGNEMLSAWMSHADLLHDNVAYWAHVGGFLAGSLFAMTIRGMRLEERFIASSIEKKVIRSRSGSMLREARQAMEEQKYEQAFLILQQEALDQPDVGEIVLGFWEASVAYFKPEEGAAPLQAWLRTHAGGRQSKTAAEIWLKAVDVSPLFDLEPSALLTLVPVLRDMKWNAGAARALTYVLSDARASVPISILSRARQLAHELDPSIELRAIRRLLAAPDLPDLKRERLEAALAVLEGKGVDSCPDPLAEARLLARGGVVDDDGAVAIEIDEDDDPDASVPLVPRDVQYAVPPSSFSDTTLVEEVDSVLSPRFGSTKVVEAAPVSVQEDHLAIRTAPGKSARLAFTRIEGVGVAVVAGLSAKPVLVIDLLLNWRDVDAEVLQVVRMQSGDFDPKALYPDADDAMGAVRTLLRELLERSAADPLPSMSALTDGPFARYTSLADYEQEVLEVEQP